MRHSVALATTTHEMLVGHLDRADGQEDLCFALYRDSQGEQRHTAIVRELILPEAGERDIHGNAALHGEYFLRALDRAEEADAGLALLHSHPHGRGWQDMSLDDTTTERRLAAQALALTSKPLIGLTLATGDRGWSARAWLPVGADYRRHDCATVRIVGDQLALTHHPTLSPTPTFDERLRRTVSVWGPDIQADLARLRIGVIGLGSVGSMVAEALRAPASATSYCSTTTRSSSTTSTEPCTPQPRHRPRPFEDRCHRRRPRLSATNPDFDLDTRRAQRDRTRRVAEGA